MALTPATILRATDASGNQIRTLDDGPVAVPGAALIGNAGEHVGIEASPLVVKPKTGTLVSTGAALEASHVVKNLPGVFYRARLTFGTVPGVPLFLQVFDSATAPIAGTVPLLRKGHDPSVNGFHSIEIEVPEGLATAAGIQVGVSTEPAVFASAGNIGLFDVFYE